LPFDGWAIPPGRSAIAEVYPALWNRGFASGQNSRHDGAQAEGFICCDEGKLADSIVEDILQL
jgi:hypothetical protein